MKKLKQILLTLAIMFIASHSIALQTSPSIDDLVLTSELKKLVDKNITEVVFLYGVVCVGGCPIGNYIFSVKDREDVAFVVPPFYSKNDMENFRRGMLIMGKVYKASESNAEFLKELAKLMKLDDWEQNFVIEIKDNKIIDSRRY